MTEQYACPFCGAPQAHGGSFCVTCGRPLRPASPAPSRGGEFSEPSRSLDEMVFPPTTGADPAGDYAERRPTPGPAGGVYAGVGRRFLAYLVDMGICVILIAAIALVGAKVAGSAGTSATSTFGERVMPYYVVAALIALAYWAAVSAWEGATGKTLGNLIAGIATVDEQSYRPIGFGRAVLRWLVLGAGLLVVGIGQIIVVLSPLLDQSGRRQGWQDRFARSVVIDVLFAGMAYDVAEPARGLAGAQRADWRAMVPPSPGLEPPPYTMTHIQLGELPLRSAPGSVPLDQLPIVPVLPAPGEPAPAQSPVNAPRAWLPDAGAPASPRGEASGVVGWGAGAPASPRGEAGGVVGWGAGAGASPRGEAGGVVGWGAGADDPDGYPVEDYPAEQPAVGHYQMPDYRADAHAASGYPAEDFQTGERAGGYRPVAPRPAARDRVPAPAAQPSPGPIRRIPSSGMGGAEAPHAMAPAPPVPVQLEFESGERRLIDAPTLIGRNPQPPAGETWDLVSMDDPKWSVSKTHVEVGVDASGLWLRDRWSTNGTVVSAPGSPPAIAEPGVRVRVPVGATIYLGDRRIIVHPGTP